MKFVVTLLAMILATSIGSGQKKHSARISKVQATKTVQEQFKGVAIKSSELENEEGKLVWSFDLEVDGAVKEVWVDANTGKVIKTEEESATKEKEEQVSEKAEKTALKKVPGDVVKSEVKKEKGKILYSFEIKTKGGKTVEADVDAETNKVVKIETEEDEKKEDGDGEEDDADHH